MGQSMESEKIKKRLSTCASLLRQEALRNGDVETWRISRLVRNASTAEQVREAERRLNRLWRGA